MKFGSRLALCACVRLCRSTLYNFVLFVNNHGIEYAVLVTIMDEAGDNIT